MTTKAIVCTIARDEDHILCEWVSHCINLGFDHVYIFDDQSLNPISNLVSSLPEPYKSKITIFRFNQGVNFFDENQFKNSEFYDHKIYEHYSKWKQHYFNNWFLKNVKSDADWCFFGDCDEFFYLKDSDNIKTLLEQYSEFDKLYVPFLIYGTSFYIDQPLGSVMANFHYHQNSYAPYGKSICRLNVIEKFECPHEIQRKGSSWFKSNQLNSINFDSSTPLFDLPIHLNHYITSSVRTFLRRKLRQAIGQESAQSRGLDKIIPLIHTNYRYTNAAKSKIMSKYLDSLPSSIEKSYDLARFEKDLNLVYKTEIDLINQEGQSFEVLYKILSSNQLISYIPRN